MEEHQKRGNSSIVLRPSCTDPNQPPGPNVKFKLEIQSRVSHNNISLHFRVPIANFFYEELINPIDSSYLTRVDPIDQSEVESYHDVICSFAQDVVYQALSIGPLAGSIGITVRILIGNCASVRVMEWKCGEKDDELIRNYSICLEDLARGIEVGTTDCGHVFHARCLREWIERNPSCPLCRFEL